MVVSNMPAKPGSIRFLKTDLLERDWKQLDADSPVLTKPRMVMTCYMDDTILTSPSKAKFNAIQPPLQRPFDPIHHGK